MKCKPALLLSIVLMMFCSSKARSQQDTALYNAILHMDSVMFDAFNKHNIAILKDLFSPNTEFYHDKGGLADYSTTINNLEQVFKNTPALKRELVPGSLEVYPIPGYGAIEMGSHKFTVTQNGKTQSQVYKFVHTWQLKDNQWKVTRAISVGH